MSRISTSRRCCVFGFHRVFTAALIASAVYVEFSRYTSVRKPHSRGTDTTPAAIMVCMTVLSALCFCMSLSSSCCRQRCAWRSLIHDGGDCSSRSAISANSPFRSLTDFSAALP